jgi:molecular chaperone DnaK
MADQLVYNTQKTLDEHGDKLGADERRSVESALEELKGVKDGDDAEAIKQKVEALQSASHRLAEVIYQQSRAQQEAAAAGAGAAGPQPEEGGGEEEEEVVDADFEVKE